MPRFESRQALQKRVNMGRRPAASRTSSTSSNFLPPVLEEPLEECPTYNSVCSTPCQEQSDFFHQRSARDYIDEVLENSPECDEELPPYKLSEDVTVKPAYSEEPSQPDVQSPRSTIGRAKSWWHRRNEVKPKRPRPSTKPIIYTREDLEHAQTLAFYLF
ncbi:hypothetical protein PV11_09446 [Exophiala sideris]|uniref:Uncharacterized protein n=1 Tax=Exophiala sideris TaxID=1016849 RepID=A0A0D1VNT5_9EURO|nr:hypothetical protein PV11_09446 [Exophiala sideris]